MHNVVHVIVWLVIVPVGCAQKLQVRQPVLGLEHCLHEASREAICAILQFKLLQLAAGCEAGVGCHVAWPLPLYMVPAEALQLLLPSNEGQKGSTTARAFEGNVCEPQMLQLCLAQRLQHTCVQGDV